MGGAATFSLLDNFTDQSRDMYVCMYVCVLYADFLTIIAIILFRKRLSSNSSNLYVYQKGKILSSKIVLDSLY